MTSSKLTQNLGGSSQTPSLAVGPNVGDQQRRRRSVRRNPTPEDRGAWRHLSICVL